MNETDLRDIAAGDVRATAEDARELALEVLRLRELMAATWPLVDDVRHIVAEHYPDGGKHDDPEYESRRSATAALVRHAAALRSEGGVIVPLGVCDGCGRQADMDGDIRHKTRCPHFVGHLPGKYADE